jgi:hypothetical protein
MTRRKRLLAGWLGLLALLVAVVLLVMMIPDQGTSVRGF